MDNNLKKEEEYSGFEPDAGSDDTFLMDNQDEYPGQLPDLFKEASAAPKSEAVPEQQEDVAPETENLIPEEDSLWDMFEEKAPEPEPATIIEPVEEPAMQEEPPAAVEKEESVEAFSLDGDFLESLKSDIEKSKLRQEARKDNEQPEVPEYQGDPSDAEKLKAFVPAEEMGEAEVIDFSLINADHPSTYHPENEKAKDPAASTEAPASVPVAAVTEQSADKTETKQKEPRKTKKWGYGRIIAMSSIAALLLVAIGFGVYMYLFDEALFRKSLGIELPGRDKKTTAKKMPAKKTEAKPAKVNDTAYITEKKDSSALIVAENKTKPVVDTVKEIVVPKQPAVVQKKIEEVKKPEIAAYVPKKQVVKETKPVVVPEVKQKPEKKLTQVPQKPVKPDVASKPADDTKRTKTTLNEKNKEVYTVQVYSTPSREDAEEWLRRLQSKNIHDGFISTQKVRDGVWYRVRFGSFESRDEARSAALRLGFSQSWIDRVR